MADSSGNARNGTAVSATWASTGRYGSAISFNGSSTRVTSSAPVSLGSAFTLMSWVLNPAASGYETVAAIGTSRDLYLYNGTLWFMTAPATGAWARWSRLGAGCTWP